MTNININIRITRNKSKSIKILCSNCSQCTGELGDFKKLLDNMNKRFLCFEENIFNSTRAEFSELKSAVSSLHEEIGRMRSTVASSKADVTVIESVVQEVTERERRKVVFGKVGQNQASAKDRVATDRREVVDVLTSAVPCIDVENIKILRLGRQTPGKNRPTKVFLKSADDVRAITKEFRKIKA